MSTNEATLQKALSRDLLETLIRFGLIVFLAVMCARIFAPFASLMIWGLILAVALEPLNARLAKRFGGRRGLAATVLTAGGAPAARRADRDAGELFHDPRAGGGDGCP